MALNTFVCRPALVLVHELCPTLVHIISFRSYIAAGGKICLELGIGLCYVAITLAGVPSVMMRAWLGQGAFKTRRNLE